MSQEGFRVSFPDARQAGHSFQLDITPEVGITLERGRREFPFASIPYFPHDLSMSPHAAMLGLLDMHSKLLHELVYSSYEVELLRDAVLDAIYAVVLPDGSGQNKYPELQLSAEMKQVLLTADNLSQERPIEPEDVLYGLLKSSASIRNIVDNRFQPGKSDIMSNRLKKIIASADH